MLNPPLPSSHFTLDNLRYQVDKPCIPQILSNGVILVRPGFCFIYSLPIDREPRPHLSQSLLLNDWNGAVFCGTHVQEEVPTTAE